MVSFMMTLNDLKVISSITKLLAAILVQLCSTWPSLLQICITVSQRRSYRLKLTRFSVEMEHCAATRQLSFLFKLANGMMKYARYFYFARESGCEVLWIVMSASVCLSVCLSGKISLEPLARSLPNFLCMLPMSVALSSSLMFTIGRITYRREGFFFPIDNTV